MRTLLVSLSAAALLCLPGIALAANLSVYPASIELKKGDAVGFIVQIQSQDAINTIGASVMLPPNLAYLSISNGTVVTDWLEQPTYDPKASSISFSGVIPNGWSGSGTIAIIHVAALRDGTYSLAFDQSQTEVYKNDGKASVEPVIYSAATVNPFTSTTLAWGALILILLIALVLMLRRRYKIKLV